MKYKLKYDPLLEDTGQKTEAYARMHRCGTWFDDGWWEPSPSQDAEKRIPREGFIIIKTEE